MGLPPRAPAPWQVKQVLLDLLVGATGTKLDGAGNFITGFSSISGGQLSTTAQGFTCLIVLCCQLAEVCTVLNIRLDLLPQRNLLGVRELAPGGVEFRHKDAFLVLV